MPDHQQAHNAQSEEQSAIEREWPTRHHRYRSPWDENQVVIDISHKHGEETLREYNLSAISLAVNGGQSPYRMHRPISAFPLLLDNLKIIINMVCETHHNGDVHRAIVAAINETTRIFIWMQRRAISNFSKLTREDVNELATRVINEGWWTILEYDKALASILEHVRKDPKFADSIRSASGIKLNERNLSFNLSRLSHRLGLPYSKNLTPSWFVYEFANLMSIDATNIKPRKGAPIKTPRLTMNILNCLALIPAGFDAIPFYPFQNAQKSRRELNTTSNTKTDGRTENIDLNVAITIFKHCIAWIYDYLPGIIELAKVARHCMEETAHRSLDAVRWRVRTTLERKYPEIKERYHLPFPTISVARGQFSLARYIDFAFVAATCLIATNHGRRRNEVNGYHKPYGLYFGCISHISDLPNLSRIEFYIEKSLQDYATFWCNKMVIDIIERLQELHQQIRPLFSPPIINTDDIRKARQCKLFSQRKFSDYGFSAAPIEFSWDETAPQFFEFIGLAYTYSGRAHPFRRIFCLLFVYRYDTPELLALSEHLVHFGFPQTVLYVTDPKGRQQAKRIAVLFAKAKEESASILEMLSDVRSEYFLDKITKLLDGTLTGGGFPRLVLAFVKRLTANATFRVMPTEAKSRLIRDRLEKHGYAAQERSNGVCVAGKARHSRRASKCYQDGELHTEQASPAKCHGCIHSLTTENYIRTFDVDELEAKKRAEDLRLPPSVRLHAARQAREIADIASRERSLAEGTRVIFLKVIQGWNTATTPGGCHA